MTTISEVLGLPLDRPLRCLAVGAHPDDIEIGAGGTLLRLADERPDTSLTIVVLTGSDERADEATTSGRRLGAGLLTVRVAVLGGRDAYLPYDDPGATKEALEAAAGEPPDLVLVHRRDDAHQDHRFAADLAWQLYRHAVILEYEVPKWDGDLAPANLYVPLTAATVQAKVDHLMSAFPSQRDRDWYSAETFRGILRLRGIECRAPSGSAEGFVIRKLVV